MNVPSHVFIWKISEGLNPHTAGKIQPTHNIAKPMGRSIKTPLHVPQVKVERTYQDPSPLQVGDRVQIRN